MRPHRIHREDVPSDAGSSFLVREFRPTHWPFQWHFHAQLELTLIVRGQGQRFVGDSVEPFADGDLCLLGPDLPHTWQSQAQPGKTVQAVVAQFEPASFAGLAGLPEWRPIAAMLQRAGRGLLVEGATRAAIANGLSGLLALPSSSPRRLAGLIQVLALLADSRELRSLSSHGPDASRIDRARARRLAAVFAYVERAWRGNVAQRAAAAAAGLSPAAFSRFFHRAVGRTFVAHVAGQRIGHACRELIETDDEVAAIAFACGFANLSNFNRAFRRLKDMTPSAYRALAQR